jgi:methionyl-tRNA synthetase
MDGLALHEGVAAAFQIVDAANEYIAASAPWTLAKDPANAAKLDEVLFEVAEAIRVAAVLLLPVMPGSSAEILRRVGEQTPVADLRLERDGRWRREGAREIAKGAALWPRAEEKKLEETTPAAGAAAATPAADNRISIDDFMKVELRVGKILEAEAVPKSKKLVKLLVDAGTEKRTILAGIAEAYQPDQLVGRTVAFVANLKPAKLMGIESNGMILAASTDGGPPTLVAFDSPVEPGARVR